MPIGQFHEIVVEIGRAEADLRPPGLQVAIQRPRSLPERGEGHWMFLSKGGVLHGALDCGLKLRRDQPGCQGLGLEGGNTAEDFAAA